jgi:hypothetical protein
MAYTGVRSSHRLHAAEPTAYPVTPASSTPTRVPNRHGAWTREAIAAPRQLAALVREARQLLHEIR